MDLIKDKLKNLYEKNYKKENDIKNRFKILEDIINNFLKLEIDDHYIKEFGPLSDDLLGRNGTGNRVNMKESGIELIDELWYLIGGYDGRRIQAKYRIISSSLGRKENYKENEDYSTYHRSLWANSNFVTNNYPHQISKFIKEIKNDENFNDAIDNSKVVLTWRTKTYLGDDENRFFDASKERLETRFPPKFLWMWAKKDEVIHPISLMAFRNFLNSDYGNAVLKEVNENYTPKNITNMRFGEFKTAWKDISNKILIDLDENFDSKNDKEKNEIVQKVSLLISQISIEEADIKNISDLLQSGNQAVILWGPPGTGKTYESMEVVKELLEVDESLNDEDMEDKYLFSKGHINRNDKGFYEIIQFHPNYTYQDFIGGISPKLDDKGTEVSYFLRDGKFKKFCDEAGKKENIDNGKKFIFIIDEINRAELSAVFGELLFALEYRGKSIDIPHFGDFTIPKNVYIIGTMNNVDKSLVTFDLALRRRFGFFKLMPKLEVIKDVLSEVVENTEENNSSLDIYYKKCVKLNKQICGSICLKEEKDHNSLDLGEDYQIGQAYFLKIKDFLNPKESNQIITSFELEKLWVYNIEPLLEEYLGMSMEDDGIQAKLQGLKKEFLKDD